MYVNLISYYRIFLMVIWIFCYEIKFLVGCVKIVKFIDDRDIGNLKFYLVFNIVI